MFGYIRKIVNLKSLKARFFQVWLHFYIAWNGLYGCQWYCSDCKTAISRNLSQKRSRTSCKALNSQLFTRNSPRISYEFLIRFKKRKLTDLRIIANDFIALQRPLHNRLIHYHIIVWASIQFSWSLQSDYWNLFKLFLHWEQLLWCSSLNNRLSFFPYASQENSFVLIDWNRSVYLSATWVYSVPGKQITSA